VPFDVKSMQSPGGLTGNGAHTLQIMVLEFERAKMVLYPPELNPVTRDALSFYLTRYLELLKHAGHHVLHSLPDFDDDNLRLTIDYALISAVHEIHETAPEVHGIPLTVINGFLARRWTNALMLIQDRRGPPHDILTVSLAEFKSVWADLHVGVHFHIKFGAPKVKPICPREVLITFSASEILFYDSEDFKRQPVATYKGWEIALMVEVKQVKGPNGFDIRYVLDLDTARFTEHLSIFPGAEDELSVRYSDLIIEFIQVQYLDILETFNIHAIYEIDERTPKDDHPYGPIVVPPHIFEPVGPYDGPSEDIDVVFGPILGGEVDIFTGYEHSSAITQISILTYLKTIWETATKYKHAECLRTWAYEDHFTASFGPLTIRLLSNEKAIVWVSIGEGTYKPLDGWKPSTKCVLRLYGARSR
jgi:hypothetical protein